MSTNLRLLLDEAITDPLAKLLRDSSSALNVEYIRELSALRGSSDGDVIKYAKREDRITVTTETGINHKKFKICTHPGIIVIAGKHRHETMQAETFRKFMPEHAVVFLSEKEVRIKTGDKVPDEIIQL